MTITMHIFLDLQHSGDLYWNEILIQFEIPMLNIISIEINSDIKLSSSPG